mmetsp:Transcript_72837/g.126432  ORF Transcript_72837/g.126432 Transcript_72837/m.126432 type:complete len:470 (+) Transcript_72837:51-1460(+)
MVQGVEVEDGKLVVKNPASGEEVGRVPMTTPEELDSIVAKAKAAQLAWSLKPLKERSELIKAACKKLGEVQEDLQNIIVAEMGKVITEARSEVEGVVDRDAWIDLVVQANEPVVLDGGKSTVYRQPHGVVALCTPWNFPADEIMALAAPALIAGNTIVVKPSEVTPLTGAKVLEALLAVLPDGVANLVQGDGTVGAPLVNHKDVDMVGMTGSAATGKKIMQACSSDLKRLVLELGGKDPMVVFADADLDKAADDAVVYSIENCGQVCCAVERIYVDDKVKANFEKLVVEKASNLKVGPGSNLESNVGPMVSKMQREHVQRHVEEAIKSGAKELYKSSVPEGSGNWFPVTVLSDITQDMLIQKEETFGPVVAIAGFDGTDEAAITLSNDTEYGLTASVYSKDIPRATRICQLIKAGQVGVNSNPFPTADASCPWVGRGASGFGYHSGPDGWRQFSMPQSICSTEALPLSG